LKSQEELSQEVLPIALHAFSAGVTLDEGCTFFGLPSSPTIQRVMKQDAL
jgi:hypothetical protein